MSVCGRAGERRACTGDSGEPWACLERVSYLGQTGIHKVIAAGCKYQAVERVDPHEFKPVVIDADADTAENGVGDAGSLLSLRAARSYHMS